ncbi:MAG TPA: hypothetical protein PLJ47_01745, partial [Candidatus Hydrogenedentes bacterium]|nr:hypothetical protein [Candidatus Hydrogenedentota bacterium]
MITAVDHVAPFPIPERGLRLGEHCFGRFKVALFDHSAREADLGNVGLLLRAFAGFVGEDALVAFVVAGYDEFGVFLVEA